MQAYRICDSGQCQITIVSDIVIVTNITNDG